MEWIGHPPYQSLCLIRTTDGYAGKQELWRREDDVPKREKYIKPRDVVMWQEI